MGRFNLFPFWCPSSHTELRGVFRSGRGGEGLGARRAV
jgi:hypothetical protein